MNHQIKTEQYAVTTVQIRCLHIARHLARTALGKTGRVRR